MPERDISSLCMWVSWGWTAWKYCSRRAAAVALGLQGLPPIYTQNWSTNAQNWSTNAQN